MSLENEIKEAFAKHDRDARPDGQSWNAVEKKVRRAHKQRLVYSSALSLVVLTAIAIVVVRNPGGNQSKGFTNPSATPTEPSTPSPSVGSTTTAKPPAPVSSIPDGFKARAGVQSGFAVYIPKDWKGGWFEGVWDFEPNGLPSTSQGGDTFALVISVENGTYRDAPGARGPTTEMTIGGRNALTWANDPMHVSYAIDWPVCPNYASTCSTSAANQRLIMNLYASTQSLWDSYETLGRRAALTVHMYDGTEPAHGILDEGITADDFSKALVRFMDSRVEGIGADEMMTGVATKFYNTEGGLYDLNGRAATAYKVDYRLEVNGHNRVSGPAPASATEQRFSITMHFSGGAVRLEAVWVKRDTATGVFTIPAACTGCD